MRSMRVEELQRLLGEHQQPCISLYMPTHRHRPDNEQDPIRYKDLVARVRADLDRRLGPREAQPLVKSLEALDRPSFWQHQKEGLALFRSPDLSVEYQLPIGVPELAVVAETFHTRPLLGYLHSNRHFYVLALATGRVALYEGSKEGIAEIDVADLPRDLRDALGEEVMTNALQLHSASAGRNRAIWHGQSGDNESKDPIVRYFRVVDRALWSFLRDQRSPLVLAGVGYYHPIYRGISRYPYLLDEGIEGNVQYDDPQSIRERAWEIVERHFALQEAEVLATYHGAAARGRGSDQLGAIAQAVAQGRVRWLLVADRHAIWGRIDRTTGEHELHNERREGDGDVLDDLAEMTLLRGGEVLVLAPDRMPSASPLAAVYRY